MKKALTEVWTESVCGGWLVYHVSTCSDSKAFRNEEILFSFFQEIPFLDFNKRSVGHSGVCVLGLKNLFFYLLNTKPHHFDCLLLLGRKRSA